MNIKAAVVRENSGPFVMEEIQLDEPRADEVIVRVVSAGICHTDLIPREQAIPAPFPAVYGHEGAGVVEKVGSQVAKLKPGDHVVMSFNSCGVCASCKKGEISYCVDHFASNFGFARFSDKSKTMRKGDEVVHGAFFNQSSFASHALGTERTVVKIPSDVPLEIMGPLGCGSRPAPAQSSTRSIPTPARRSRSLAADRSVSAPCWQRSLSVAQRSSSSTSVTSG